MNASIQRERPERRCAGHGTSRLWLSGLCGIVIILGGAIGCSRSSSDTSNADVPAHAVAPAVASIVVRVSVKNLQFNPLSLEIQSGDVVEWKNEDIVIHTATSASFDSGTIASGQSWRHTFTNAGEFSYACTYHPQMKGVVIVK